MIKKIVFSYGGIKGLSYIGLIKYLEENNLLGNIDTYIGTSIGSLFATLLSIKYTYDDFNKHIKNFDYYSYCDLCLDNLVTK